MDVQVNHDVALQVNHVVELHVNNVVQMVLGYSSVLRIEDTGVIDYKTVEVFKKRSRLTSLAPTNCLVTSISRLVRGAIPFKVDLDKSQISHEMARYNECGKSRKLVVRKHAHAVDDEAAKTPIRCCHIDPD